MELVLNQHKLQISCLNLSEEEYFYPHEIVVAEKKTHFQVGKHFNNITSTLVLYTESIVVLYSFLDQICANYSSKGHVLYRRCTRD